MPHLFCLLLSLLLLPVSVSAEETTPGLSDAPSTRAVEVTPAPAPPPSASPLPLPGGATGSLRLTTGPGGVVLSWIAEGDERGLYAAPWTDEGWGRRTTVTRRPGLLASWADAPTVIAGATHLVAAWIEEVPGAHAMHLWASRSADGGASWSEPLKVHDDASATEHGFATLFPRDDGSTEIAWLDGRGYAGTRKETALLRRTLRADGTLSPEVTSVHPFEGGAFVTWVEENRGAARLMGRTVTAASLGPPRFLGMVEGGRSNGFPSYAVLGDQMLIVSTSKSLVVSTPTL